MRPLSKFMGIPATQRVGLFFKIQTALEHLQVDKIYTESMYMNSNLYSLSSFKRLSMSSQLIILGNDGVDIFLFFNLTHIR